MKAKEIKPFAQISNGAFGTLVSLQKQGFVLIVQIHSHAQMFVVYHIAPRI